MIKLKNISAGLGLFLLHCTHRHMKIYSENFSNPLYNFFHEQISALPGVCASLPRLGKAQLQRLAGLEHQELPQWLQLHEP